MSSYQRAARAVPVNASVRPKRGADPPRRDRCSAGVPAPAKGDASAHGASLAGQTSRPGGPRPSQLVIIINGSRQAESGWQLAGALKCSWPQMVAAGHGVARRRKCDTFVGGPKLELLWGHRNLEKIQAHGLEPEEVETAFDADDWATIPSELPYRLIGEGTSNAGRLIRVIYAETDDGLYPITAFPIRLRQRRTP
jgi:uncharacterized DUF497 family protein